MPSVPLPLAFYGRFSSLMIEVVAFAIVGYSRKITYCNRILSRAFGDHLTILNRCIFKLGCAVAPVMYFASLST